MSLSHHQQHQLRSIEDDLLQSAPELAARLHVFGVLSATEAMPPWEEVPTRRDRVRQAAALTAEVLTLIAVAMRFLLSAILPLLIVIARGSRVRPPARGQDRAGPGHAHGGRPDSADS
jgi:hypothetical protein